MTKCLKRRAEMLGVLPGQLMLFDQYFSLRRRLWNEALSQAQRITPALLRGLLKQSGQSLRQMARLMEFSPSYLCLVLHGKVRASPKFIEQLSLLAKSLPLTEKRDK